MTKNFNKMIGHRSYMPEGLTFYFLANQKFKFDKEIDTLCKFFCGITLGKEWPKIARKIAKRG